MNSQKTKGICEGPAGKVKRQLADLNNLLFKKDKEEELLGQLQNHLMRTKKEFRKIISKL
jgi:hypothetical protein